jgi:hypothetical protein
MIPRNGEIRKTVIWIESVGPGGSKKENLFSGLDKLYTCCYVCDLKFFFFLVKSHWDARNLFHLISLNQ